MLYAMKDNRQTKITEEEKGKFINAGYEIAKLVDKKLEFEVIETEETKEIKELQEVLKSKEAEIDKLKKELEKAKKEGK